MSDFAGAMESLVSSGGGDSAASAEPSVGTSAASSPDAATPTPSSDASASDAQPPASAEATAAQGPPGLQAEPGPVPYKRFQEVNTERTKFKQDLERYAWAQGIEPEHGQSIAQFVQALRSDPVGTLLTELQTIAQADPERAQAVRSFAARMLNQGRGQAAPAADLEPEPDLQAGDGTLVYSAQQLKAWNEWNKRQLQADFAKQVQPLQQFAAQEQAQRMRADIQAKATQWAQDTYAQWSQRPHFAEHRAEIGALMRDRQIGVGEAYAEILATKVLPTLSAQEQRKTVDAMTSKVAAGTTNPTRMPVAQKPRPKDFGEAFAQLLGDQ